MRLRLILATSVLLFGCKTSIIQNQNTSDVSNINTKVHNFKKARTIGANAAAQFKQWPGEPNICFADVTSAENSNSVAIYQCALQNNITENNALILQVFDSRIMTGNTSVGSIDTNGALINICSGAPWAKTCSVQFSMDPPDGKQLKLVINIPNDPTKWTYKLNTELETSNKVKKMLQNIGGERICFGSIETSYGTAYGLYLCNKSQSLNSKNTKVLYGSENLFPASTSLKKLKTWDGFYAGRLSIFNGVASLSGLCNDRDTPCTVAWDGQTLDIKKNP